MGQQILAQKWSKTTKAYVLKNAGLANVNFLSVPLNSDNKAGAMVAINHMGTMEAQFMRAQPEGWGAMPAHDPFLPAVHESGWDAAFDYINVQHDVPTVEELFQNRVMELDVSYKERLNADFGEQMLTSVTTEASVDKADPNNIFVALTVGIAFTAMCIL